MSAFDLISWLKTFGGQAESRAGSLTGDLSQRDKATIARILQSTSPGLGAVAAGSLGEQIQWLVSNVLTASTVNKGAKTAGTGFFLAPSLSAPITLTPSASSWTYGAWAQVVASTGAAIYVVGVLPSGLGSTGGINHQIEIGTGAAASETAVSDLGFSSQTIVGVYPFVPLPAWVPVPTTTRIAARIANDAASAGATLTIRLLCINQSNVAAAT